VIRVYDEAGHVIETHEHVGEFKPALTLLAVGPNRTRNRRRSIMMHMLIRSKVADFAKWKPVYDAHLSARQRPD
jgi:hypothetical protein